MNTTDLYKVYGATERDDSLTQIGENYWLLVFGFQKDDESDETGWTWRKNYSSEPTLAQVIADVTSAIDDYDTSDAVNCFFLGDEKAWLDRDTRVSVKSSTEDEKASGEEYSAVWINGMRLELPCDSILSMLRALEVYAKKCYDATMQHKYNIANAENITQILGYDYTANYPEKLTFNI